MLIARSFDINKPGAVPSKLVGGIVGGAITQGKIKIGDKDHTEYNWFKFKEIKKLHNLALSVKHILPQLKKVLSD